MNLEPAPNASSSAGPATPTNHRKERGAIAAQACENCRQRKQRCSEERPKCATCQRMKLECKYREPQPTKKDKTLVEILDRLKNLEGGIRTLDGKVDNLNIRGGFSLYGTNPSNPTTGSSSLAVESGRSSSWPSTNVHLPAHVSTARPRAGQYKYVSAAYKMLSWPVFQQLMESSPQKISNINLASLGRDGSTIMLGPKNRVASLPLDTLEASTSRQETAAIVMDGPLSAVSGSQHLSMNWETMHRLTKAYFDTFNLLYPILDRLLFKTEILPFVARNGFDEGINSTLACLVLALGEVAIAGHQGMPLTTYKGRPGGIKGGTIERPPGLAFFNEARRRMGFSLTECSLENVQIFALAAIYYESCCHHAEFWRMVVSASLACQALLTSNPGELTSPRADLIRRLFWHCSIMETCLNLELNLPLTGLDKLEDLVGLPDFSSGSFSEEDYIGNQASYFQEHFASQIVLRRLSVEFHTTLTTTLDGLPITHDVISPGVTPDSSAITTIKQLAAQLDQWRGMLPIHLRWQEGNPDVFPTTSPDMYQHSLYPPVPDVPISFIFTADLDAPPVSYPYVGDVQTACLRTRYLHVKYLIHRPFLFKALHHPEHVTQEDAEGVAICLQSILLWPITLSPVRHQKRLIPCLFFWSQNLLGVLLILHLVQTAPILVRIRGSMMDDRFDMDAKETTRLCIDWIRDLKDIDASARWCWSVLGAFYPLEE